MSTNQRLARLFAEMAAGLEITGASVFRVNAHRRVAEALRELTTDVATIAGDDSALTAIDGIGASSARKIAQYCAEGRIDDHEKLFDTVPIGLLELLAISGLGPKTVKLLWEQASITDLDSLKEALDAGVLETLPRLGAKSLQNIREAISFRERSQDRMPLGKALPLAEAIVASLEAVSGVDQLEYAGSLRRGRETIGDIDLLAATSDPGPLGAAFTGLPGVQKVLVAGDTKISLRMDPGVQVDLRMIRPEAYGAALLYFTGSKEHNIVLRERAIKQGMRLNEYGLFPDDGEDEPPQSRGIEPVAAVTEEAIYARLELPYITPALREGRGECAGPLPDLVQLDQIGAELHAHTTASDGRLSIEALVDEARDRGFHTLAVTDHSQASVQASGLSPERLREHVEAIRAVDGARDDITVLAGSEVDILVDGTLDYDDETLGLLDFVVASPHAVLKQPRDVATARLIRAIEHPSVHVLGHPTGRLIGRRDGLDLDMDAIAAAAAEHSVALEINASPRRLDLRDIHVRAAVDAGALIAINTDAHGVADFDHLRYGVLTARRGWLTAEQCVNCWPPDRLLDWIRSKSVNGKR